VDGYGRTTEYIRRPSKWDDIDRNLRALDENFEIWKIKWATVSCTVQMHNILNLDRLFHYLRSAGFAHVTPVPQLVPLFYPPYLSIQALPPSAKEIARRRLELEIERADANNIPGLAGPIGSVRSTISFMDEADKTSELHDFLAFTEASDHAFGDSWREAVPELADCLDAYPLPKQGLLAGLVHRLQERLHV
jgi:hypothetical protein